MGLTEDEKRIEKVKDLLGKVKSGSGCSEAVKRLIYVIDAGLLPLIEDMNARIYKTSGSAKQLQDGQKLLDKSGIQRSSMVLATRISGGDTKTLDKRLGGLEKRYETLAKKVDKTESLLILSHNLAYIFDRTALEYQKARTHVETVLARKEFSDYLQAAALKVVEISFSSLCSGLTALAVPSGGGGAIAGLLLSAVGMPLVGKLLLDNELLTQKSELQLGKDKKTVSSVDIVDGEGNPVHEVNVDNVRSTISGLLTNLGTGGAGLLTSALTVETEELIDPLQFFLMLKMHMNRFVSKHSKKGKKELEQSVREFMDQLALPGDDEALLFDSIDKRSKSSTQRRVKGTLEERTDKPLQDLCMALFEPYDRKAELWRRFEANIQACMRQFVWRMHCRSRWPCRTGRYAVRVSLKSQKRDFSLTKKPPSLWPASVWARGSLFWPKHFADICGDFAYDTDGVKNEYTNISRMVVQCCQVKRLDVDTSDALAPLKGGLKKALKNVTKAVSAEAWLLDLDQRPYPGKTPNDQHLSMVKILFDPFEKLTKEQQVWVREARTKGQGAVGISQLMRGTPKSGKLGKKKHRDLYEYKQSLGGQFLGLAKPTGKKGNSTDPKRYFRVSTRESLYVVVESDFMWSFDITFKLIFGREDESNFDKMLRVKSSATFRFDLKKSWVLEQELHKWRPGRYWMKLEYVPPTTKHKGGRYKQLGEFEGVHEGAGSLIVMQSAMDKTSELSGKYGRCIAVDDDPWMLEVY